MATRRLELGFEGGTVLRLTVDSAVAEEFTGALAADRGPVWRSVDAEEGTFWIDQGEPHDDAVAVGEAVAALAFCDVEFPADWTVLQDWGNPHGLSERAVRGVVDRYLLRQPLRRAAALVSLVVGTAILGRPPIG